MLATAICRKPSATWRGVRGSSGGLRDLFGECCEFCRHDIGIERLVAIGAEDRREMARLDLADADIGIGHGQRAAVAGSRRARDRRRRNPGPTRKRAPSKCRMEPPPAATVLIAIIGARMRTPATAVSKARSKPPA